MRSAEQIGERLYRKIVTPVYGEDRRTYVAGCIIHGVDGAVSVRFLKYENGKGIVGVVRPSEEIIGWLRLYREELKEYINRQDEIEVRCAGRVLDETYQYSYRHGRPRRRF